MKVRNNILRYASLLLVGCMLVGYAISLSLRTADIAAVHTNDNFSDVLVNNSPLTDKGKINWWLNNKAMLKERFNIPKPASYGSFTITFWDFGNGYQEEGKYDRLCFDDMKTKNNCIDKNPLFSVRQIKNDRLLFITYDGRYSLNDKGEVVKIKREYD
ncbi:TPA: DUF943 family protein [Serratia rubidaea]|uniref:DUF943 family protein n=1 Tax=Serratia rubidaea TaxID=61652 RepID=UPI00242EA87D|nr:DUF943 family protein [Serratia rubidaea]MCR0997615.1 DUF943 family protein [Serratia rubidaea]HDJ1438541.1 DUF943 family protein [Serratia rubidaea]HDJ1447723.1 DUF943 family protein [Serratia rubidaea]HDJ1462730.1 DUF943 family protein [Serratia rubidaea]HDJ2774762.1 DUF943 family protein [Serratia rubidaea]